jgi:hypothetical protein
MLGEGFKKFGVPEKVGNVNEKIVKEKVLFFFFIFKEIIIVFQGFLIGHHHPSGDTPSYGRLLLMGEIIPGP